MTTEMLHHILPDIPRFYTALAEWLACLVCICGTKRRLTGWKFAGASVVILGIQSVFFVLTKEMCGILWLLCMAIAVGVMYFYIMISSEMNWKDGVYYCTGAFVAAETVASLEWQIDCFFSFELQWSSEWMKIFWLVLIYGLFYFVMWWVYKGYRRGADALLVTNHEMISYVVIGIAVFLMSNLGFIFIQTPFSRWYMPEIFRVRTIVDLGGLAILYAYHVQRMELRARHELENMQIVFRNHYIQYQQAKEAIDIINYKHHDLKHHIIALRAEEDDVKRKQYLDQMEEELGTYEAQHKTGNKVLDTLLTAKKLYCMEKHITLTSVVDGKLFEFMDVMDLCSIFGNALDNAIEYEKQIPEQEKRLIHVSAYSQHNFLIVRFENYCEENITFQEELPITTKQDTSIHGYGVKSIRYTVRKYGGEVDFEAQDNWFVVKILIPLKM